MTLQELHDWSRTQDPELYVCEICGKTASIEDPEFKEKCSEAE